ncbi:MAG: AraC family transcriptional regulator [Lactobacillus sp.]|nr:AraC family transcriptional regulator [Lactobacillus sp.]
MEKFIIDGRYGKLLAANGIQPQAVLAKANLPMDTFAHEYLKLSESEYFAMISAINEVTDDPLLPTKLVASDHIETFSPPIFAAYCSKDGKHFLQRLAHYKKLIGPVTYQITEDKNTTTISLSTLNIHESLPSFFVKGEFAFLVQLLSKATNKTIKPLKITTTFSEQDASIQNYFGLNFTLDTKNAITFSNHDLQIPFVSENTSILEYLEPELKKRLADLDIDDSYGKRVRNVLVEILPRGEFSIEDVARALGISKRTLQRKLKVENTNFQQQLNATREMLAKNYLLNTSMTTDDIAFLLAYQETNSFLRAFNTWTGMSVQKYREQHN